MGALALPVVCCLLAIDANGEYLGSRGFGKEGETRASVGIGLR